MIRIILTITETRIDDQLFGLAVNAFCKDENPTEIETSMANAIRTVIEYLVENSADTAKTMLNIDKVIAEYVARKEPRKENP